MATGIIGGVGQYDHVKETFVSYTERLEMFFSCEQYLGSGGELGRTNSCSKSERKKAIFLSEVGPVTYAVISNLVAPTKPKDIVLEEIKQKN